MTKAAQKQATTETPNEIKFTKAQQKCIDTRKQDVLVSAAAGSGKTAVLVERIIQMILDENNPVNIDELLVVTFTKAAAGQMKEKVSKAVAKRLANDPNNEHLERQAALIHNAQITTIDSFCTFVIRNNFGDIGLDPGFRVGDEGEMKLLRQDVLGEVLEAYYENGDEHFLNLATCFSKGIRDEALEKVILDLYDIAMSYPFPEKWLQDRLKDYNPNKKFTETDWYEFALKQIEIMCESCINDLTLCQKMCESAGGPYMYGEMIDADLENVERFLMKVRERLPYATLQGAVGAVAFQALSRKKDDSVDSKMRDRVKEYRGSVKDRIKTIKERYLLFSEGRVESQLAVCADIIKTLVEVVLLFTEAFSQKKREKNILDFNDLEHMALQILIRPSEDGLAYERTETALEYANHFKYVMIDEYQDSNLVQEYLLESISGDFDNNPNRFMVGDVKQSIYKFRLAKPEIFLEKYDTYRENEGERIRIDLQQNFRSRVEVVEAVNYIFERIMKKGLGGINYDERARLNLGATYPDAKEKDMEPELLLYYNDGDTMDMTSQEMEAYGIANRIEQLVKESYVTDEETKELRPVMYKDIVILLRTMNKTGDTFKRVLESQGIPTYIASKSGYFGTLEVRTLLHLLKCINNPLQDIPFYGVLHSFVAELTEDEISLVRALEKEHAKTLYEQCVRFLATASYEQVREDDTLANIEHSARMKLINFFEKYKKFREEAKYQSIYELIQNVLTALDYRMKISAMSMGDKRLANIDMILQKAADYEKTSFYGLYDFIRYIELLERYEIDYGEANTLGEQANVVRIMTMHASKGLEFSVCFVSDLAKQINMRDTRGNFLLDSKLGIGMKCIDISRRTVSDTLRRTVVSEAIKQDSLAEEIRILYVALTRAKEKLIMTGIVEKPGEEDLPEDVYQKEATLPNLLSAKTLLDYVLLAYDQNAPIDISLIGSSQIQYEEAGQVVTRKVLREKIDDILCKPKTEGQTTEKVEKSSTALNKELKNKIDSLHKFKYEFEYLKGLHTKTSVSELKKAAMQETDEAAYEMFEEHEMVPYLPKFVKEEEEVTGTVRGNAYHKFMELFDFKLLYNTEPDMEMIEQELKRMQDSGKLPAEYAKVLWKDKLLRFFQSNAAKRMAAAAMQGKLYKEQPFVLGIEASRLDPKFPKEETVLIQGIIDVFFEEDGKFILLDYKTDRVDAGQQLIDRYKTQMDYYEEALLAMKGKVEEKIIYSFALGEEIMVY